jgi:hypothetical protein
MINTKVTPELCYSQSVVDVSSAHTSGPRTDHEQVLQDLFRGRLEGPSFHHERCTNERPKQRAAPLMGMSALESKTSWNPNSLFLLSSQHQIPKSDSPSAPFPLNSALFTSHLSNTTPMTGDAELDLRIRSFSNSLMKSSTVRNKKRPRNLPTRFRLVGQVLGTKGVQKVVDTVKAIQQIQATETRPTDAAAVQNLLKDTVLVEAWENTPVGDLKSLPWEEMLQTSVEHLKAYRDWKAAQN